MKKIDLNKTGFVVGYTGDIIVDENTMENWLAKVDEDVFEDGEDYSDSTKVIDVAKSYGFNVYSLYENSDNFVFVISEHYYNQYVKHTALGKLIEKLME